MKNPLIVLTLFLIIGGCATQLKIDTDMDKAYDLSSYSTFSIEVSDLKEQPSQISINPIMLQRVSRSLEQSLVRNGFKRSTQPDIIVRFFIATEREVERSRTYSSWHRRGYFDDGNQRFYRVDKDSLTIRFHDSKTGEVVWYAFSRFNRSNAPKEQEEVNTLIEEVISKFKAAL